MVFSQKGVDQKITHAAISTRGRHAIDVRTRTVRANTRERFFPTRLAQRVVVDARARTSRLARATQVSGAAIGSTRARARERFVSAVNAVA